MKERIKGYLIMTAFYLVIYLNYFINNENIQNITNVFLWIWIILFCITAIFSISQNEKKREVSKRSNISKAIANLYLFVAPVIMLYFGDIAKGTIYLVSLLIIKIANMKK